MGGPQAGRGRGGRGRGRGHRTGAGRAGRPAAAGAAGRERHGRGPRAAGRAPGPAHRRPRQPPAVRDPAVAGGTGAADGVPPRALGSLGSVVRIRPDQGAVQGPASPARPEREALERDRRPLPLPYGPVTL
ncbi:hypothetical protein SGPA1_30101 [Streptomyces misionensis JCM 4497]